MLRKIREFGLGVSARVLSVDETNLLVVSSTLQGSIN